MVIFITSTFLLKFYIYCSEVGNKGWFFQWNTGNVTRRKHNIIGEQNYKMLLNWFLFSIEPLHATPPLSWDRHRPVFSAKLNSKLLTINIIYILNCNQSQLFIPEITHLTTVNCRKLILHIKMRNAQHNNY